MRNKILVILPFRDRGEAFLRYNHEQVFGRDVDIAMLDWGERAKETPVDAAITLRDEVKRIIRAQEEGYHAVLVGCYLDPGVQEAKRFVRIPVFGVADISVKACLMLGNKVGIITTSVYAKRGIEANLRRAGMARHTVTGCVDISVDELLGESDRERLLERITCCVRELISKDNIDVLTFGSGALYRYIEDIESRLRREGIDIPVIHANKAAVEMVRALCKINEMEG